MLCIENSVHELLFYRATQKDIWREWCQLMEVHSQLHEALLIIKLAFCKRERIHLPNKYKGTQNISYA